ncbi:cob(I)yrinic acid a,c-diamide adenosyltransferase [Achromobacter aloeverae]|uniref:Cobalamin adenosyltransferase n=1 Tax=Achromobacter aloeverae TaxID=1750518 RepID=A0A4V1MRX2_9BURK|nr:cob(I)yrinic acid a,c-diamide adenosyltransferase [Achromobacter aloeverae]RXN86808.1 ATP:cob(I)alamin adenosyltransferase [Achromobacter aloeverae]
MANRLSVIATRTGDDGTTGLGDGTRVGKDDLRIAAMGDVDELNSTLGLVLAEPLADARLAADLRRVQHCLFDLGAELSIPGYVAVQEAHAQELDDCLKHYNATLAPLQEFILPGGTRTAALLHVARTICRRAERAVVALGRTQTVRPPLRQYLNRLSDLLFVAARHVNQDAGTGDLLWKSPNSRAGA